MGEKLSGTRKQPSGYQEVRSAESKDITNSPPFPSLPLSLHLFLSSPSPSPPLSYTSLPPSLPPIDRPYIGYKTYWNCNSMNSYVKGGMSFRQEDQSLYFPTCGYYYISSQVLFQYSLTDNQPNQNFSARHGVEIQPNCGPYDHTRYLYSYSSLEQKEHVRASTFIGDIAKICEGGSIRIVVPERGNLCCAQGESMMTHFSTYLVEKTDCS